MKMPKQESKKQDPAVSQESSPPKKGSTPQAAAEAGAAGEIEEQAGNEATAAAVGADLASEAAETGEKSGQQSPDLPDFSGMLADAAASSIELLNDVELDVKIELGRSELSVGEILKLAEGSVVELDKLAGDPVDILVNEQLIARGEVLVVNDNFCVRINEIIPGVSETVNQK